MGGGKGGDRDNQNYIESYISLYTINIYENALWKPTSFLG